MSRPAWWRIASASVAALHFLNAALGTMHANPWIAIGVATVLVFVQQTVNEGSLAEPPRFDAQRDIGVQSKTV